MSTLSSSSSCSRSCGRQRHLPRAATASTAAVPAVRHRSSQRVTAQLQQPCNQQHQHQQQLPALLVPRPSHQLLQQQEQRWPQQLQGGMSGQQSRCSVVAGECLCMLISPPARMGLHLVIATRVLAWFCSNLLASLGQQQVKYTATAGQVCDISSLSGCGGVLSVVCCAAAGRRRRQDVGAEEGDPDLDIDDVM